MVCPHTKPSSNAVCLMIMKATESSGYHWRNCCTINLPTISLFITKLTMLSELELLDLDKMFSPRNEDEMKELTERLHSYIKKMRELRTGAPALDTNNFFKVS